MGNPLLWFWWRRFGQEDRTTRRLGRPVPRASAVQAEATIFLMLRRMRTPLIVLITIFAVSVLGLTLVPGQTPAGLTYRMGFFQAFYFMTVTASTVGYGELPYTFTAAQRLWVTVTIYLTVIGWAYAISSMLALVQERGFRQALALRRFTRKVSRLREPFVLIVGYGRTGELLGRAFDAMGRRFVVLDVENGRIDALDLDPNHADVPGLVADARDPSHLGVAGIGNPHCEAVLALTSDDEANLAVTMTAALLRPELPVIARTVSPGIADRMHAFGTPTVVNPFDRFGHHLRIALRAPASFQLMMWLSSGPGAELPPRSSPPRRGRWVVCGYGRLERELVADLHADGLECTVVYPAAEPPPVEELTTVVAGRGYEPTVLEQAGLAEAVGFVAATHNDTTNLSLIAAARRVNPSLFVTARQNRPSSGPLFAVMDVDSLLVPHEVVAREVYAQLSTPLLWRFLQEVPGRGNSWAADVVDRLTAVCGQHLGALWKFRLNRTEAPALTGWLAAGDARLGDLLRDPDERAERLDAVVLVILRPGECLLTPDDDVVLAPDDELLLAGRSSARRALDRTLWVDAVRGYVVTGRHVPESWIWRQMSRATRNGAE